MLVNAELLTECLLRQTLISRDDVIALVAEMPTVDLMSMVRDIRSSAGRFSTDLAQDPHFAYNIADAQNRMLLDLADKLEARHVSTKKKI